MSIFLILPLGFLIGGAFVTLLLVRFRPRYALDASTIISILSLATWLIAGRNLPLEPPAAQGLAASLQLSQWFAVDSTAWRVSLALLILLASSMLVMLAYERSGATPNSSQRANKVPPLMLLISAAVLLSVWAASIPAVASGWTLTAAAWALLKWSATEDEQTPAEILRGTGIILSSLVFLFLAAAATPNFGRLYGSPESWSPMTRTWALLGGVLLMGAFPFQRWRAPSSKVVIGSMAVIHLAPAAAGAHFLTNLAGSNIAESTGLVIVGTILGLLGLIYSIAVCWSEADKRSTGMDALATCLIGVIVLASVWAGRAEVSSATTVLLLGVGGLMLTLNWPGTISHPWKISQWIHLAAIAGIPLTAGFTALGGLYSGIIGNDRLLLAIVAALLLVPTIAAGILMVHEKDDDEKEIQLAKIGSVGLAAAFSILVLGLVELPAFSSESGSAFGWGLVLASAIGGAGLSWLAVKNPDLRHPLSGALPLHLHPDSLWRALRSIAAGARTAVYEASAILEGEGGMVWLLVLVVILWLARVG